MTYVGRVQGGSFACASFTIIMVSLPVAISSVLRISRNVDCVVRSLISVERLACRAS